MLLKRLMIYETSALISGSVSLLDEVGGGKAKKFSHLMELACGIDGSYTPPSSPPDHEQSRKKGN